MANKAEEWVGKVIWMSRENGQVEFDRGRMDAYRKLESTQMRVGRRLLGASNRVQEWQCMEI